jgi:hypothetical protein
MHLERLVPSYVMCRQYAASPPLVKDIGEQLTRTPSQVAVPRARGCSSEAAMSTEKATVRVFPAYSLPLRGFLYCLCPAMMQNGLSRPSQVCIGTFFNARRRRFCHLPRQRESPPTDVYPPNVMNHSTPRNIYYVWAVHPRQSDKTRPIPLHGNW